jgi:hypothetical protein
MESRGEMSYESHKKHISLVLILLTGGGAAGEICRFSCY